MIDSQRGDFCIAVEDGDEVHYLEKISKLFVQLSFLDIVFGVANSFINSAKEGKNGIRVQIKQSINVEFSLYFSVDQQISFDLSTIKKLIIEDVK